MNNIIYVIVSFLTFTVASFSEVLYKLHVDIKDRSIYGKALIVNNSDKSIHIKTDFLTVLKGNKKILKPGEKVSIEYSKHIGKYSDFLYLMENWYPEIDTLAVYSLSVTIPEDFTAISEAEKIKETLQNGKKTVLFYFGHPAEDIHLVASKKYAVKKTFVNGVEVYTYFFKEDISLADSYLKKAVFFIKEYEKLLGKFPYKRFSIVENMYPTGYSFPTFTLIGKQILKYPFILTSSLPHEILHQWFGCSVYVDYTTGNWSEGLTTYLSDHLFSKDPKIYRKKLLLKYMAFVNENNEYPLKDFRYKKSPVDEAIGYGKGAMVFHMLKNISGDTDFFMALRRFYSENMFKKASWKDIKAAFEKTLGTDLRKFFKQWVEKKGIPSVKVVDASSYLNANGEFQIDISLKTDNDFSFILPVKISSYRKNIFSVLDTSLGKGSILMEDIPLTLKIDEKYDTFRKLSKDEVSPVLYFLLGEENPVFIVEKNKKNMYLPLFSKYKKPEIVFPEEFSYDVLKGRNVVICGRKNPVLKKIFGKIESKDVPFIRGFKNPFSEEKNIYLLHVPEKDLLKSIMLSLKHYGGYTYVSFGKDRKRLFENTPDGINIVLNEPSVIETENGLISYKKLITYLFGNRVIYIGEQHTKFSHHIIQYQIIKDLYEMGMDLAIGMEMFSRSYQKYLDMYIKGDISEKEFLKRTNYFTQWKYDYNYYKPILRYARKNKIPVLGLNLDLSIIEKVARKGIDSLSKEEKEKLPEEIDFSNLAYKKYLYRIYSMHTHGDLKDFQNFYQSQLLWDETMAETASKYLKKHPEKTLIVLAGNGHLMYGYGIPDRVKRRVNLPQSIILQDEEIKKYKGDFFIRSEPFKGVLSKKLGIYVVETGEGLKVDSVIKTSVAEKAGIKKGDIIVEFNGKPIKNLPDLKVLLISPPKESSITVLRKGKRKKLKLIFD